MKTTTPTALANYRSATGKRLDDIAVPLGVYKSTVLRWEKGTNKIPVKHLLGLNMLTGIPLAKLRPDIAEILKTRAV